MGYGGGGRAGRGAGAADGGGGGLRGVWGQGSTTVWLKSTTRGGDGRIGCDGDGSSVNSMTAAILSHPRDHWIPDVA